jgi:hypothetical protein
LSEWRIRVISQGTIARAWYASILRGVKKGIAIAGPARPSGMLSDEARIVGAGSELIVMERR